jgi:serine/threonine protein kinase/Tol biopolymer transport system component
MIGRRVGSYEIEAAIGAGGMGEVYRARDLKLARRVAIKLLPSAFAADAERLQRFEREARLLASLNHPYIATIHGVEDADGAPAIVMELIEGETLAERIAARPGGLPAPMVTEIGRQLADALDAAHQKGVVHRDLKPANIKLTPDGIVKVLDFGLSKLDDSSALGSSTAAPPPTVAATVAGHVFGTPAYMSPEQARGQAVDKRTDIWAFGCVLFELLTGRAAFEGSTSTDILAAVLDREPDWSLLPPKTPPHLHRLLRRCLDKDVRRRLRDSGDIAAELEEIRVEPGQTASRMSVLRVALFALAAAVAGGAAWLLPRSGGGSASVADPILRTTIVLADDQQLATGDSESPLALSPDGTKLAYVAQRGGQTQLYVRALSSLESVAIAGTTNAQHPFFSADGEWIGFFADGALQKVSASGGAPLRIVTVPDQSMGASWGLDGTIVYAVRGLDLMRVSSNGGIASPLEGSGPAHWPEILPDGKTVLFTTGVRGGSSAIATMPLVGGPKRIIARTTDSPLEGPAILGAGVTIAQGRLLPVPGFLVYGISQNPGGIRAIRIDPTSLEALGPALPLVESIERGANGGGAYFAVSNNGLLVYASTRDRHELVWVDRKGSVAPITADRAAFRLPHLSPDGTRVAVAINDETRRSDIWVYDAVRGTKRRLTSDDHNLNPVWTPDGSTVTFGDGGLAEVSADVGGLRRRLLEVEDSRRVLPPGTSPYPMSWSPDGRDLLFGADQSGLWIWSRDTGAPRLLLQSGFNDYMGRFSPDGQRIAYVSNESGRPEVYVARYPDLGSPTAVSTEGGTAPRWSRDGNEIFYRNGDAMLAVQIESGEALRVGKPSVLFTGDFLGAGRAPVFDVAPDGERFVMVKSDEASTLRQLTVVQHWFDELRGSRTERE